MMHLCRESYNDLCVLTKRVGREHRLDSLEDSMCISAIEIEGRRGGPNLASIEFTKAVPLDYGN
jgi:hypothetical protein